MARKEYSDIAAETTLSGNLAIGGFSMVIASATGWPAGTYPFVAKIENELVLCTGRSGTTVTISGSGRGYSGTTAIAHLSGVAVSHVWDATSANDFGRHIYDTAHDDHSQYQKESEKDQNNGYAGLDSGGLVPAARIDAAIARDAEVTAAVVAHVAAVDPHGDRAALTAHEADTTNIHGITNTANLVVTADARLDEPGDLKASARSTPSTGWLLCDGTAVSRTTYAALFSAISTTYGVGDNSTTFNVPDFRGRVVVGAGTGASLTARTRGQTGGEETHLLITSEMPTHAHTMNSHNHTQNAHTHTDSGHQHFDAFADITAGAGIIRLLGPGAGGAATAIGNALISTNTATNQATTATMQNQGGGATHNVMQPFGVANMFIKT